MYTGHCTRWPHIYAYNSGIYTVMGPIFQAAFVALVSTLVGDSIPAQVEEGGIVPHCDILSVLEM